MEPYVQSSPRQGLPVANDITAKLSRFSTRESTTSTVTLLNNQEQRPRSTSRGRGRQYQSSGIGGIGNIRRASSDSSERTNIPDGPDDFSSTRGREPRSPFRLDKVISIGRGGAGNIRSPSRDVARPSELSSITETEQNEYEESLIRNHEASHIAQVYSGGRGGVGNMIRRHSQPQSGLVGPEVRATSKCAYTHQRAPSRGLTVSHPARVSTP